jgi:hypothetical protein
VVATLFLSSELRIHPSEHKRGGVHAPPMILPNQQTSSAMDQFVRHSWGLTCLVDAARGEAQVASKGLVNAICASNEAELLGVSSGPQIPSSNAFFKELLSATVRFAFSFPCSVTGAICLSKCK